MINDTLPNLFIIGAPKTGTTALANNLAQHKDIFLSKQKEPRYFDRDIFYDFKEDYITKSLDEYYEYYLSTESKDSKYRVDASVFNMYTKNGLDEILSLSPNAKFIIVLREPVSASLSMHRQRLTYSDLKMRELSENFMDCWNMLEDRKIGKGYPENCRNKFLFRYDLLYSYELYLPYIIETVKKENLFIGFYDDFISKPEIFYNSLFKFLEIDPMPIENKIVNKSTILKKSKLLEYIDILSKKSFNFRNKVGLRGGILLKAKKIITSFYRINKVEKQFVDKKVYTYFSKTNNYISDLKKMYKISND